MLKDPYLQEHLNPLFLAEVLKYDEALGQVEGDVTQARFNLTKFCLKRLFLQAYSQAEVKGKGVLFFLTHVHSDGLGDYYALLKSVKAVKKALPSLKAFGVYTHEQKLPEIELGDYLVDGFYPFWESEDPATQVIQPVLEGKKDFPFTQELKKLKKTQKQYADISPQLAEKLQRQTEGRQQILKEAKGLARKMEKSAGLVNISLALNTFDNPALRGKSLYFAETGNFQGIANSLELNWFSMGLKPFEEGIFLDHHYPAAEKLVLPNICVAYLTRLDAFKQAYIYLQCLLSTNPIIVLPQSAKSLLLNLPWLRKQGIERIETLEHLSFTPKPKTLYLVPVLPTSPSYFSQLIQASSPLVGCTGDGSISEVLSYGKLPFYETRAHKKETLKSLLELASFLKLQNLLKYFSLLDKIDQPEETALALFPLVKEGALFQELEQLTAFIRQHFYFEKSLISHLKKHLLLQKDKKGVALENHLIENYFHGKIGAEECYRELKNYVSLSV